MSEEIKTGIEKARETAHNLGGAVATTQQKSEVDLIKELGVGINGAFNDPELAKFYNESARMGSENLGQSMPMLKIHVANKSHGNTLENGSEPNDGWFFHTKTHKQFKNPIIHILSISRSFYTKAINEEGEEPKKPTFNQILSGVINDEGDYIPFIMYFSSNKLRYLWDFTKLIQPLIHKKPVSIPMFALPVQLSTEKIEVEYDDHGKKKKAFATVVRFDLVRTEKGIEVCTDIGKLTFLRDLLEQVQDEVDSLINSKDVGKDGTGAKSEFENADGQGDPIPSEAIEDIIIDSEAKKEEMPF